MKLIRYTFLFSSAVLFLYGCACTSESKRTEDVNVKLSDIKIEVQIPEVVIKKADETIIKKTGPDFFEKYITLNLEKSRQLPDGYYLVYTFEIPGKDYINEDISLMFDKKGKLQPAYDITGIPECQSGGCNFDVTKDEALKIAEQSGLKHGIKDWQASFDWDSTHGRYVWQIRTTLNESTGSNGKKGTGETLLIDADTGTVLSKTEWKIF